MSYAQSICDLVTQRSERLAALEPWLARADDTAHDDAWTAREILLHLAGALAEIPSRVQRAATEVSPYIVPAQRGGTYIDDASVGSAAQAAARVQQRLHAIVRSLRGVDDDTLRRPITMAAGDGQPAVEVPVGRLVRYSVTVHVDEHLEQLAGALQAASGKAARP